MRWNRRRRKGAAGRGALGISGISRIRKGSEYRRKMENIRFIIIVVLAASFAVFAAIAALAIYSEGLAKFVGGIESMNPYYFLAALGVIFLGYVIRFPKWEFYLRKLKVKIPRAKNFLIYLSMYSMDITPGRWGRAMVSYTINRISKVSFARTFPAVVADIFTDFLGFVVVLIVSMIFVHKFFGISLIITILLVIPFVFVYIKGPFLYVKKRFGHIKRLRSVFDIGNLYFRYNKMLKGSAYAYSMLYTIPAMFLNGLALYLVILAFGVNMPLSSLPTVLFIFSSSLILGMISGLPATLGVTDAALIGYLTLFFPATIGIGLASIITIFFRIATVWFVEGFGFSALLYTMKYWSVEQ
ncbi:MAG: flippase-like domain-containing protein [Candidatus Marsarchaeota archaeon]|jgi:uncharacterized protein (TIRG00374 family)|nr:flippase-like domain-containing protein [Candidatus Marsarchaeota archaeon]